MKELDMSGVRKAILSHDILMGLKWAEVDRLTDNKTRDPKDPNDAVKAAFAAMNQSAQAVGKAFWAATMDRNSLDTILCICGNDPQMPGTIPGWFREMARQN